MTQDLFKSSALTSPGAASRRPSPSPARRPNRRFTPGLGLPALEGRLAPAPLALGAMFGAQLTITVTNADDGATTPPDGPADVGSGGGSDGGTILTGPDTDPAYPIV